MSSTAIMEDRKSDLRPADWNLGTRALAIAVVLWLGSNIFVSGIAKFAAWEDIGAYKGIAGLCKWDCNWYGSVIDPGYFQRGMAESGAANWVFPPLFPLSAYPLHQWLKVSLSGSLVVASKVELLLAIYAFLLMFGDEMQTTSDLLKAGSLVAFNPYVIYGHAGYAEPLYFALIALGFYFARRRQWVLAGAAGGLSSATRVVGAVFGGAYVVSWLRAEDWRARRKVDLNALLGLLLCPLGIAVFMLYMHHHMGDALAMQHGHVAWGRELRNPFQALWSNLAQPHWSRVWAVMMIVAWLVSIWLFRLRKPEMAVFMILGLSLAALEPMAGYWGVARYIWWQPPFLYAIYRILRRSDTLWTLYLAFASGMAAFMVVEWMAGHRVVV